MVDGRSTHSINIDDIFERIVGPRGFWQTAILFTVCLTISSPVMFPVFTNAVPRFRCALNNEGEAKLARKLVSIGDNKTRHLTFDEAAQLVGPWFTHRENISISNAQHGCLRYKSSFNDNISTKETEPCLDGYVYEFMENQYPSTIVAEWDLVCENSWKPPFSTSIYMLGMMVGFMIGGFLGGRLGRMKAIYIAGILESAFGLAVTFAPNYAMYTTLRFLLSTACTIKVASISVILVEMTTARYRAIFSAGFSFFINFLYRGSHAVIAMFIPQWRFFHLFIMLPAFLGVIVLYYLPESPRWLVSQGKNEAALKILYRAYKINAIYKKGPLLSESEFQEECGYSLLDPTISHAKAQFSCYNCVKGFGLGFTTPYQTKSIAKCSLICTLLFVGQLCSFFGLLFYTRVVRGSVYYVALLNAATAIPAIVISTVLYSKIKRRKLPLMSSYGASALILLVGGTYAVVAKPESEIPLIVCCNIALVLLGSTLSMLFIYTPELFPSIRTQGLGNAAGLGRIGSILCSFVNQLDMHLGHGAPIIIYGAVLVLQVLLTYCLPDTDGKNLADVVVLDEDK